MYGTTLILHKNVDIKLNVYDVFLEKYTPGTFKFKIFESQII